MDQKLINAVIRQIGERDYLEDVARYGADGGFPGFTYFSDTLEFFGKHKASIIQLAEEEAEEFGVNVLDMIKGFNCLNDDYDTSEIARVLYGKGKDDYYHTYIGNALAWFALEEVARYEFNEI